MNKSILALILILALVFISGCTKSTDEGEKSEEQGNAPSAYEELNESGEFIFKGKVTSIDSKKHIEMEIVDSKIAFGTYWVLVSDETLFFDAEGNEAERGDVQVGSIIEVVFSGQVMNSFPPQIAARKIYIK